jgi:hypothetical protein
MMGRTAVCPLSIAMASFVKSAMWQGCQVHRKWREQYLPPPCKADCLLPLLPCRLGKASSMTCNCNRQTPGRAALTETCRLSLSGH